MHDTYRDPGVKELSVVVPCYNSATVLPDLLARTVSALRELAIPFEIILIDDCSRDNLRQIAETEVKKYQELRYIELMFNVGQFRALMCGLQYAVGDYVVTMDDDLQHPPEEISKLYRHLKNHPELDIVIGAYQEKKHGIIRNMGSAFIGYLNTVVFNKPATLKMSAFRCLRRQLVKTILMNKTHYPILGAMILSCTRRIANLQVRHDERKEGCSNYSFIKLLRATLDNILSFSSLPLQIISMLGITVSMFSICVGLVYLFLHFIRGSGLMGWTSLFLSINFYGGLVLLSLGIVGEYLVRIFGESKRQPRYVVRDIIEN
jgi:polyisoprenyl-phosphate glycosyltransferase